MESASSQRQGQIKIQQLFNAMQTAEKSKDIDQDTYRKARVAYYRAAEGEEWLDKEAGRLGEEADALTKQWKTQYDMLQGLRDSHRDNLDAVRAATDGQSTLHKDVKFAVGELRRLIGKEDDERNLVSREAELRQITFGPPGWLNTLFDVLIVGLLLLACYILYQYLGVRWTAASAVISMERAKAAQASYLESIRAGFT